MKKGIVYIHGKSGNAGEAERYRPLFPQWDVLGFEYQSETPWEAQKEFEDYFRQLRRSVDRVMVLANSIGAYLLLSSPIGAYVEEACFISPIVDMERLIIDMMGWAGVTETELRDRGTIETGFGENLSWDYLCYVRNHPIHWTVPTRILYGEKDHMTSYETVASFARKHDAALTVMPGGEHWFHTPEQMQFLDGWLTKSQLSIE